MDKVLAACLDLCVQADYSIEQAEATKPSKVSRSLTAIVWMRTSFVDTMKSIINCTGTIELQYRAKFLDECIKYIINDMMLFNFVSAWAHLYFREAGSDERRCAPSLQETE